MFSVNDVGSRLDGLVESAVQYGLDSLLDALGISGYIGCFGLTVFRVSQSSVRTFESLTRTSEAVFADHDVVGSKPVSEFIGLGQDRIEIPMVFSASLGVDPATEVKTLLSIARVWGASTAWLIWATRSATAFCGFFSRS